MLRGRSASGCAVVCARGDAWVIECTKAGCGAEGTAVTVAANHGLWATVGLVFCIFFDEVSLRFSFWAKRLTSSSKSMVCVGEAVELGLRNQTGSGNFETPFP